LFYELILKNNVAIDSHCKAKETIATEKTYPAQLPLHLICVKHSPSCTSSLAAEAEHHFISKQSQLAVIQRQGMKK